MKHHILAKYIPGITEDRKNSLAEEIKSLFEKTVSIHGIHGVEVFKNCVARDNRYDIMIVITMDKSALEEYDGCIWHKQWKEGYGNLLEKKAIFDCE